MIHLASNRLKDVGEKSKASAGRSKNKETIDNQHNFSAIMFSINRKRQAFAFKIDKNGSEWSNRLRLLDEQIDDQLKFDHLMLIGA